MKALQFFALYFYAFLGSLLRRQKAPSGLWGSVVCMFYDKQSAEPNKPHGVVAFVLPPNKSINDYLPDLWGPFGFTSQIDLFGKHLYGRDTWGAVQQYQLEDPNNYPLYILSLMGYPPRDDKIILLAGVRKIWGEHIWPLNQAHKFRLVEKK